MNIPSGTGYLGGAHYTSAFGGYSVENHSALNEANEKLIAHELGHWLGLPHTFESIGAFPVINLIKGGTKNAGDNFMDYNLQRKRWYKTQLINCTRIKQK